MIELSFTWTPRKISKKKKIILQNNGKSNAQRPPAKYVAPSLQYSIFC